MEIEDHDDQLELSSYQELQDRNNAEKKVWLEELLSEFREEEKSQVPAVSRPKKRKKKVINPAVSLPPRKSRRLADRPGPVPSYEEDDEEARGRSRKVGNGGARARSRQLRPRRPITYVEKELEPLDSIIFCTPCGFASSGGCPLHPPVFSTGLEETFNLQVKPSHIKKAGDGVINRGDVIAEGVLFGPYPGKFYSVQEHKKQEESGMAWRITNPEGPGVLGFVDPGVNPTGKKVWMAKVNCTTDSASQNLVGFQYHKKIFYRVCKPIPAGVELLVYYGDQYARSLGIRVDQLDLYKGREDHTTEGVSCGHCHTLFATQELLQHHLSINGGGSKACLASLRMKKKKVVAGKRFPCGQCGKTFSLQKHVSRHIDTIHGTVSFVCSELGCGLSFTQKSSLTRHVATVHKGLKGFKCSTCGQCFGEKRNLTSHVESVHEKIRLDCPDCPATFTKKSHLNRHLAEVHGGEVRVQSSEKKHACNPCQEAGLDRKFRTPKELLAHVKKDHEEIYKAQVEDYKAAHPYICRLAKCVKRFKTKVERSRHEKQLH